MDQADPELIFRQGAFIQSASLIFLDTFLGLVDMQCLGVVRILVDDEGDIGSDERQRPGAQSDPDPQQENPRYRIAFFLHIGVLGAALLLLLLALLKTIPTLGRGRRRLVQPRDARVARLRYNG